MIINNTFLHGNRTHNHDGNISNNYLFLTCPGTYNHMLIALSESNASLQMDHVQLLSLNGTPLYEIPMKEMDNETNTYVVNAFIPPDEFFNIAVSCFFIIEVKCVLLIPYISAALSSAPQHAMPPEFGRKWGMECLNTKFPLPTLLCAGYSVKLIKKRKDEVKQ